MIQALSIFSRVICIFKGNHFMLCIWSYLWPISTTALMKRPQWLWWCHCKSPHCKDYVDNLKDRKKDLFDYSLLYRQPYVNRIHTVFSIKLDISNFIQENVFGRSIRKSNSYSFKEFFKGVKISFINVFTIDNNSHRCCTALTFGPPATPG